MKDINAANISVLIHFMDGLNDPRFTMEKWVHDCDTPACALGWACTVPALQKAGLSFAAVATKDSSKVHHILKMAHLVFGDDVFLHLFASNADIKTPQQWADCARLYLKSNGYEVAPQTPAQAQDFSDFMERVLAPRPELQGIIPLELPH